MTQARNENASINLDEYRRRAQELKSLPRFVVVELTQGCNLRCPMCRSEVIPVANRRMSLELFSQVADELFSTAELIDLRGWGESLVLPEIQERVAVAAKSGAEIRFVTNLSFRRPDAIALLARHHAHVGISADTADPFLFRQLRINGRLDLVEANLNALGQLYKADWGTTERLSLICTVQRPALLGLENLVDLAAKADIRRIQLSAVSAPPGSLLSIIGYEAEVDEALGRVARRAEMLGIDILCGTRLGSHPANPPNIPSCLHPWAYAHVAYDGSVGFCDHLIGPELEQNSMGVIDERGFRRVWNGPLWQALRREHTRGGSGIAEIRASCAWCYKNRAVEFEDRFAPELAHYKRVLTAVA
ncbi:radical SAM protein [Acidisoma sp. S159]|uniref:radical SAM protein n=1 Tax=Acidisoma sp. S159 TaxID=1747225 RepID=UPI00131E9FC9|nr:radical SAM protein [Acidisoma sp. S159]